MVEIVAPRIREPADAKDARRRRVSTSRGWLNARVASEPGTWRRTRSCRQRRRQALPALDSSAGVDAIDGRAERDRLRRHPRPDLRASGAYARTRRLLPPRGAEGPPAGAGNQRVNLDAAVGETIALLSTGSRSSDDRHAVDAQAGQNRDHADFRGCTDPRSGSRSWSFATRLRNKPFVKFCGEARRGGPVVNPEAIRS